MSKRRMKNAPGYISVCVLENIGPLCDRIRINGRVVWRREVRK